MTTARTQAPADLGFAEPIARRHIVRPDGRTLAWIEWGAPDGTPVLCAGHAGDSGERHSEDIIGPARSAGLRLVMVARAGLGSSTRNPGRTVVDDGEDLLAVADALELERATLLGVCVGAGSTLAFAARHPERARRLVVVSTLAPLSGPASDAYLTPNLVGIRRLCRVPIVARWAFGWQQRRLQRDPEAALARTLTALRGPDAALALEPVRLARSRLELPAMFAQPFYLLDE